MSDLLGSSYDRLDLETGKTQRAVLMHLKGLASLPNRHPTLQAPPKPKATT